MQVEATTNETWNMLQICLSQKVPAQKLTLFPNCPKNKSFFKFKMNHNFGDSKPKILLYLISTWTAGIEQTVSQ